MPAALLLLASVSTVVWLVLAVLAGSLIVGGTAFFFVRARAVEDVEAKSAPTGPDETRALGERIETALREQRLQGETQRQVLAQKIEGLQQAADAQRAQTEAQIETLHGTLHEVLRRLSGAEAARPSGGAVEGDGQADAPPATPTRRAALSPPAPPIEADAADGPSLFEDVPLATFAFEEVTFEPAAPGPSADGLQAADAPSVTLPSGDGQDAPVDGPPDAPPVFEAWDPSASGEEAPDAPPEAAGDDGAAPHPEGADDLTVISTIDEDTQARLYAEGILTLDEIACWSRSDARRVGAAVEVPEDTIMNRWVFEAQAAVFDNAR
jgi:predicted flap endonuclease-1-like 5' DNA nuclease